MPPRHHEVTIAGPRGRARGFVEGYLAGRGALSGPLPEAEEEGFDAESLRERLSESLHPGSQTVHLLVEERSLDVLREAVGAAGSCGVAIRIVETRPIAGARFEFSLAAYSEEHGRRILGWFERLPGGVRLEPAEPFRVRRDPRASGTEVYAPAHAYELRGEGAVEGDLEGVLALLRLCRDEDLVRVRRAVLEGGS